MKYLVSVLLTMFCYLTAQSQKLPKVQKIALRAPSNLKIDGKFNEWGADYQAYNPTLQVYYTLANDNDNLYLVLKSTNPGITSKLLVGGVTLEISSLPGKPAISFPIQSNSGIRLLLPMTTALADVKTNMPPTDKQRDSAMYSVNRKLVDKWLKEIGIKGLNGLPDSTISVYNDLGVTCRSLLDREQHYICELAVPLKYLSLSLNGTRKFEYTLKLNGAINDLRFVPNMDSIIGGRDSGGIDLKAACAPTTCSGQYELTGK